MITRRTFIKRIAQGSIAAVAAANLDPFTRSASAAPHPLSGVQLRIPAQITGGNLTMAPASFQIYPGVNTDLLLINNSFPAPTIRIKKGDTFSATINNNLTEDSLLHWHGVQAPSPMGGHPKYAVPPGSSYNVNFPIIQRASTNFYHAHPDMNTGKQFYMGIAGMFLIEDDEEKALGLPSGEYEIPLMISDKRFNSNNQLIYSPMTLDINSGWLGDTILVNGTPSPFLPVARTLYRFRIVNASNSRFYKIALSDANPFTIIGNDGGFLDKPVSVGSSWLLPAERLDILIDFSTYSQAQNVTLKSLLFSLSDAPGTGSVAQGAELDLLEFQVTKSGTSRGVIPSQLPAIIKYQEVDSTSARIWNFAPSHAINDNMFAMNRIDANVPFGALEKWTFQTQGENSHPVHVHGVQFQVVDRGGSAPDPAEAGWKDVVRVDESGPVNVLLKFDAYQGLFLIHCHKLEHADMGMMANLMVGADGGVPKDGHAVPAIMISPNPASSYAMLSFAVLQKDEMLVIVDEKGNTVVKELLSTGSDKYEVDASRLPTGRYSISLENDRANLVVVR